MLVIAVKEKDFASWSSGVLKATLCLLDVSVAAWWWDPPLFVDRPAGTRSRMDGRCWGRRVGRGRKSRIARLPVSGARFETEHLTSSRAFVVAQTMAAKSLRARPNSSWTERRNNTRRKGAAHQTRTRGACWRLKYNGSVNCASANVVFFTLEWNRTWGFECLRWLRVAPSPLRQKLGYGDSRISASC